MSLRREVSEGTESRKGYKCIRPLHGLITEVTRWPEQTCAARSFSLTVAFPACRGSGGLIAAG